jgi:hypothetical protein
LLKWNLTREKVPPGGPGQGGVVPGTTPQFSFRGARPWAEHQPQHAPNRIVG